MNDFQISDIHMHCVWGYDDGSESRDMTRELLRQAREQGVRRIACTSHGNAFCTSQMAYDRQFALLQELVAAEFPEMQVCTGTEIRVYPGDEAQTAQMLADGQLHYLGRSQRAMIELSVHAPLEAELEVLEKLLALNVQIVVAHAERYHHFAGHIEAVEALVEKSVRIQINAYSLELEHSRDVRHRARELVRRGLVHYIGSDAHRTTHRPPLYTEGVQWIYGNVPRDYADQIVWKNAEEFFG